MSEVGSNIESYIFVTAHIWFDQTEVPRGREESLPGTRSEKWDIRVLLWLGSGVEGTRCPFAVSFWSSISMVRSVLKGTLFERYLFRVLSFAHLGSHFLSLFLLPIRTNYQLRPIRPIRTPGVFYWVGSFNGGVFQTAMTRVYAHFFLGRLLLTRIDSCKCAYSPLKRCHILLGSPTPFGSTSNSVVRPTYSSFLLSFLISRF